MRNAIAVMALFISVGGIFVSLAREEMRCYLGLVDCSIPQTTSPQPRQEASQETPKTVTSPTKEAVQESNSTANEKTDTLGETQSEVKAVDKTNEAKELPVEKETAQKSLDAPFKSQPIEVIPPPEAHNNGSQPIEVIPPPGEKPQ